MNDLDDNDKDLNIDINTRFEYLEQVIDMVAKGFKYSAIVTGAPGMGKSHVTINTLKANMYTDVTMYKEYSFSGLKHYGKHFLNIRGYTTPFSLYRDLYENRKAIIIYDDCNEVFENKTATSILMAATDSGSKDRIVSWKSSRVPKDLPKSFKFEGSIIFVTNILVDKIRSTPLGSRSIIMNVHMNLQETLDRMEFIIQSANFMPDYSMKHKQESLEFLIEIQDSCREISIRTLEDIIRFRGTQDNWKVLAQYTLSH